MPRTSWTLLIGIISLGFACACGRIRYEREPIGKVRDGGVSASDGPVTSDTGVPADGGEASTDAAPDNAAPTDGGDAAVTDASDGSAATDASDAATPDATIEAGPTVYNSLSSPASWSLFNASSVNANAVGFSGGTFDGRFVYFVPSGNGTPDGIVLRYDTSAPFASTSSYSTFDTTTVNPSAKGFSGAAFDGRYVYLVPANNGAPDGVVARYDTQGGFTAAGSWSTFDTTTVNALAAGFSGATFDGRYVYFAPNINSGKTRDGVTARYDTQASFTAAGAWTTFDLQTLDKSANGYSGALFDGRYVYVIGSLAARYDTQAGNFASANSWTIFNLYSNLSSSCGGFRGEVFDGRYIYAVPHDNGSYDGLSARYDTQGSMTNAASWSLFDTTALNANAKGFFGGAFDGRYVYFVPFYNGGPLGLVTRYDTHASYTAASSWTTFDTSTLGAAATEYQGAVFDGRYLYFIPNAGSTIARFEARSPPAMPNLPQFHGSFF